MNRISFNKTQILFKNFISVCSAVSYKYILIIVFNQYREKMFKPFNESNRRECIINYWYVDEPVCEYPSKTCAILKAYQASVTFLLWRSFVDLVEGKDQLVTIHITPQKQLVN